MQWIYQLPVRPSPGPEVTKLFSCSTQLSMKLFLLINVRMPITVGILTFMNRKNSILGLSEPEKCLISWYFYSYEHLKFHAQLSWEWKKFYNLGAWFQTWRRCLFQCANSQEPDQPAQLTRQVGAMAILVKTLISLDCWSGLLLLFVLLFYVHGKHLKSCRDGQLT